MTAKETTTLQETPIETAETPDPVLKYDQIKLRSVEVEHPPFRKLKNISIPISDRFTVIGGHNGIGKSTILGLIANGSGVRSASLKSYFDLPFQAAFHELFTLSEAHDYKEKAAERGSVILKYELLDKSEQSKGIVEKKCNVTKHSEKGSSRLKIVPRTLNKDLGLAARIGNDARIPLPTIYLGMSRVNPIGELDEDTVDRSRVRTVDTEDAAYYRSCLTKIVQIDLDENESTMLSHSFKGSKKRSKLPMLKFDSLAISSGQDSLGSILTALTSFKRIQRQQGKNYLGGILVIDEIEAGLHPHAQLKLVQLLKKEARSLKLQVIATTHSLVVMKEIFDIDEIQKERGKILDSVVYITDSTEPVVMDNPSYQKIEANIYLTRPSLEQSSEPVIKVYFEDKEAKYFFEKILEALNLDIKKYFGVKFDLIPLGIGCQTLLALSSADEYFEAVIVIFDEDVLSESKAKEKVQNTPNFLTLPTDGNIAPNSPPEERNPEMVLHRYMLHLFDERPADFWARTIQLEYDGDQIYEHILNLDKYRPHGGKDRDRNEQWFLANKDYFDRVGLISFWTHDYKDAVDAFIDQLKVAVQHLLNRRN